jgi:SAM-dependent methyltransferase
VISSDTTWGAGDYPLMARHLEPAAVAAVQAAEAGPADRVLDVAAGTGNAALLAAQRRSRVVGIDFEPTLLRLAEQRSRDAGSSVHWAQGDVGALPVRGRWADVVLSVFGVMYASGHAGAVRELARVAAPGARIVLASWIPGGVIPAMGRVVSGYLPPPPPPTGPPSTWGDEQALEELLIAGGLRLAASSTQGLTIEFADSAAAADFLIRTAGHLVNEQERLTASGRWQELHDDLIAFVERRAEVAHDQLRLRLQYLLATATAGGAPSR